MYDLVEKHDREMKNFIKGYFEYDGDKAYLEKMKIVLEMLWRAYNETTDVTNENFEKVFKRLDIS